jgi:hypothetical protein
MAAENSRRRSRKLTVRCSIGPTVDYRLDVVNDDHLYVSSWLLENFTDWCFVVRLLTKCRSIADGPWLIGNNLHGAYPHTLSLLGNCG